MVVVVCGVVAWSVLPDARSVVVHSCCRPIWLIFSCGCGELATVSAHKKEARSRSANILPTWPRISRRPIGPDIVVLKSKPQAEFSVDDYALSFPTELHPAGQRGAVELPIASTMTGAVKIYFIVFGVLTIVGGIIGYVSKGSVPSIIAGSISGILLLAAGFLLAQYHTSGLVLALIVSI